MPEFEFAHARRDRHGHDHEQEIQTSHERPRPRPRYYDSSTPRPPAAFAFESPSSAAWFGRSNPQPPRPTMPDHELFYYDDRDSHSRDDMLRPTGPFAPSSSSSVQHSLDAPSSPRPPQFALPPAPHSYPRMFVPGRPTVTTPSSSRASNPTAAASLSIIGSSPPEPGSTTPLYSPPSLTPLRCLDDSAGPVPRRESDPRVGTLGLSPSNSTTAVRPIPDPTPAAAAAAATERALPPREQLEPTTIRRRGDGDGETCDRGEIDSTRFSRISLVSESSSPNRPRERPERNGDDDDDDGGGGGFLQEFERLVSSREPGTTTRRGGSELGPCRARRDPRVVEWSGPCCATRQQRRDLATGFVFSWAPSTDNDEGEGEEEEGVVISDRMGLGCRGFSRADAAAICARELDARNHAVAFEVGVDDDEDVPVEGSDWEEEDEAGSEDGGGGRRSDFDARPHHSRRLPLTFPPTAPTMTTTTREKSTRSNGPSNVPANHDADSPSFSFSFFDSPRRTSPPVPVTVPPSTTLPLTLETLGDFEDVSTRRRLPRYESAYEPEGPSEGQARDTEMSSPEA
ncbi:hypothetical protein JCM11491_000410 [Sporobolomyces phaffii]